MKCIFCSEKGPYNTVEHIIPESLGNDDTLLANCVCDKCQDYFGREIENFVLNKTPFAFWRVWYGIKSKKRNLPSINFSLPKKIKERYHLFQSIMIRMLALQHIKMVQYLLI